MNTCTKCGAANTPEAFSCGNCGAPLRGHALSNTGDNMNTQAMGRLAPVGSKSEKASSFDFSVIGAKLIQIAVGLAIVGALLWFFLLRTSPEIAADKMIQGAIKGDINAVTAAITTDSAALLPKTDTNAVKSMASVQGDGEMVVKVTEVQINGDTATANVSVAPKADTSSSSSAAPTQPFQFRKENGKWKVNLRGMIVEQFRRLAQANPGMMAVVRTQIASKMGGDSTTTTAWNGVFKEAMGQ